MADVMPTHHGGDGGDELPRHPLIVLSDYQFPPPKRSQHSKSLTTFQLYTKLGGPIPIQFDLEGKTFYVVGQYSEHYVRHIGSLIQTTDSTMLLVLEVCTRRITSSSPLTSRGKINKLN